MTKVPGTEIYWIVLFITIIEIIIGFYQIIHYLERPSDNKRLSYLTLVWLLIGYNLSCGFFPDATIPIPEVIQVIIAFILGIATSIYFAYYLYKVYELHHIKKFFIWGSIYGLILPFLLAIVVVYSFTLDLNFSRQLFVIIPGCYGLIATVVIGQVFIKKVKKNQLSRFDAFSGYLTILCWIVLPFILYAGDHQVLQHSVSNFGFLVLTISYIRKSVFVSQKEYEQLKQSEESLRKLNEGLAQTVKEKTEHLEELIEQRTNIFVNLSHELRTPLTLLTNQLQDFETKYEPSQELENIKLYHQKISRDIQNGFDVERIKNGIQIFNHQQVADFSTILTQAITQFKGYAKKKQLNIISQITPNLHVEADPEGILAIINNLVTNAIKYSHRGAIDIQLRQEKKFVILIVKDEGIGIEDEMQERIFHTTVQN